eukprot:2712938-Rhodomonas_salina.1
MNGTVVTEEYLRLLSMCSVDCARTAARSAARYFRCFRSNVLAMVCQWSMALVNLRKQSCRVAAL